MSRVRLLGSDKAVNEEKTYRLPCLQPIFLLVFVGLEFLERVTTVGGGEGLREERLRGECVSLFCVVLGASQPQEIS